MKQLGLDDSVMNRPRKRVRWLQNAQVARNNAHFWLNQANNHRSAFDRPFCLRSFHCWMFSARHCVKLAKVGT